MSWRQMLQVSLSDTELHTHNTHNTQKPSSNRHSADIAYIAYGNSAEESSRLQEDFAVACSGVDVQPSELERQLSEQDIRRWRQGEFSSDDLALFACLVSQRKTMELGRRPEQFRKQATCKRCGPIWLWTGGEVAHCPWCWNRINGKPIPRPCPVRCGGCLHFMRISHPNLGHCTKGEPEAVAGIWDTDTRFCKWFNQKSQPG